jgi:hydrogenase maturation protease
MTEVASVARSTLLLGLGNPCRGDDGLGPALAARFEADRPPGVEVDVNYQLTPEDCLKLVEFDAVVLMDAAAACELPFTFGEVTAASRTSLSTHSVAPESVAAYARDLFRAEGRLYVLGIRGVAFAFFEERLSDEAGHNLDLAECFLRGWLVDPNGWCR